MIATSYAKVYEHYDREIVNLLGKYTESHVRTQSWSLSQHLDYIFLRTRWLSPKRHDHVNSELP